ncbi:MAG: phosphohydrolase [Treponema sp.]|jgi:metal-dependent HD superfamily phosphatase/phosphodiesterase|nr:phosphohydrolase [Treponema sp.]
MKSPKELSIDKKITNELEELIQLSPEKDDLPLKVARSLMENEEIEAVQNYANDVSIMRLGFNDHGPVHMRTVTYNAIRMLSILYKANIPTSLQKENAGSFCDSVTAVILASFLHDFGMSIGRQDHELYSVFLALPIIEKELNKFLPEEENLTRRVAIRSVAMEGIVGHMGTRKIHSLEAGLILIADGCDMTKGRARIPMVLDNAPKVGDIHKYSANSIESVQIIPGTEKPIRIQVNMSAQVGFFQIEEVLLLKINASPAKKYIELLAGIEGNKLKQYL